MHCYKQMTYFETNQRWVQKPAIDPSSFARRNSIVSS